MRLIRNSLVLATCIVLLLSAPLSAASLRQDVPAAIHTPLDSSFTYQGRLDKAGEPITALCAISFSLFNAAVDGIQIGISQAIPAVNVSGGLFTISLNGAGEFGGSAFDGSQRFLEIAVQCEGDEAPTILPRQLLTAAPYAVTSLSTEGLQGRPISDAAPAAGQSLTWDGVQWTPQTLSTDPPSNGAPGNDAPISWNSLTDIPAGFADNVDNDSDGDGAIADWNQMINIPPAFADNVDNDSSGDVTGVVAGSGLTGGGSAGDVALALDTTLTDSLYWQVDGNAGLPSGAFLGTTDNTPLTLGSNNTPALRIVTNIDSATNTPNPNIIGGIPQNVIAPGVVGAVIAGGGSAFDEQMNVIFDSYGVIGGGKANQIGVSTDSPDAQRHATIGGGLDNAAVASLSTIGGGRDNLATGEASVIGGGDRNFANGRLTTIPGGKKAIAILPGQFAYAAGGLGNDELGSAQMSMYILRNEGIGSKTLLLDGGTPLVVRPKTTMVYTILVVGRTNNDVNLSATYRIDGAIIGNDVSGGSAILSDPVITVLSETAPFQAQMGVSVNTTGGALNVVAFNSTTTHMRWAATVFATEVTESPQ